MANLYDEQFKRRLQMHLMVCDPISADIIQQMRGFIEHPCLSEPTPEPQASGVGEPRCCRPDGTHDDSVCGWHKPEAAPAEPPAPKCPKCGSGMCQPYKSTETGLWTQRCDKCAYFDSWAGAEPEPPRGDKQEKIARIQAQHALGPRPSSPSPALGVLPSAEETQQKLADAIRTLKWVRNYAIELNYPALQIKVEHRLAALGQQEGE